MMYVGMIETRSLKILPKSFHENYTDLFKKNNTVLWNMSAVRISIKTKKNIVTLRFTVSFFIGRLKL